MIHSDVKPCNVAELLATCISDSPLDEFLVWHPFEGEPRVWTYSKFGREVYGLAQGLREQGIGSGDRVLIHLQNCPEFLMTWFALTIIGAVAVCTNARASPDELRYFCEHSRAVAAITESSLLASAAPALATCRWIAYVDTPPDSPGQLSWHDLAIPNADPPKVDISPLAEALILYTSGTTSRPKAVLWTHANVMWAAESNAVQNGLEKSDTHLVQLPLFHTNALTFATLPTVWMGARMVLVPKFSASRFWEVSTKYGCTWTWLSSFLLRAIAEQPPPASHCYRIWGTGVSQTPVARRLGIGGVGAFGMTETVGHPIVTDPKLPCVDGAIGRASQFYEIEVRRENGVLADVDEAGEVFVKGVPGKTIFAKYADDPAATTAAVDARGWFATGDRMKRLADGSYQYIDRAKDTLRVGSENVSPSEIERVLLACENVKEAAVVGLPHPMLDEVPVAFVVAGDGTQLSSTKLIELCRSKLADFKVPREVYQVDELPKVLLGKVAKNELRKRAIVEHERLSQTKG